MLLFKKKILFNIIARNDENIIEKSIESILKQKDIRASINVACLGTEDSTFYLSKRFCKNPSVYEPETVLSDSMAISKVGDEKTAIGNGILLGRKNECQYYCFMHCPVILDCQYSEKLINVINNNVIGAYSDILDSGTPTYTSLTTDKNINIGSCFLIKSSIAERFNHNSMGEFLHNIVNIGVMINVPEFLVESKWLESLSKRIPLMSKQN